MQRDNLQPPPRCGQERRVRRSTWIVWRALPAPQAAPHPRSGVSASGATKIILRVDDWHSRRTSINQAQHQVHLLFCRRLLSRRTQGCTPGPTRSSRQIRIDCDAASHIGRMEPRLRGRRLLHLRAPLNSCAGACASVMLAAVALRPARRAPPRPCERSTTLLALEPYALNGCPQAGPSLARGR
jgi:hypothetical protein